MNSRKVIQVILKEGEENLLKIAKMRALELELSLSDYFKDFIRKDGKNLGRDLVDLAPVAAKSEKKNKKVFSPKEKPVTVIKGPIAGDLIGSDTAMKDLEIKDPAVLSRKIKLFGYSEKLVKQGKRKFFKPEDYVKFCEQYRAGKRD